MPMMTGIGVILGTAYMAPEQARGRPADKRSDIWAFGCVVYEMLTGKRACEGGDVSDSLAFIITEEPDWRCRRPRLHRSEGCSIERSKRIGSGGSRFEDGFSFFALNLTFTPWRIQIRMTNSLTRRCEHGSVSSPVK